MAQRKRRSKAEQFLGGFGLGSQAMQQLAQRFVRQQWSLDELAMALVRTKQFRRRYPGLSKGGELHRDFIGAGVAFGASAVLSAVGNYDKGLDDFNAVAKSLGVGQVNRRTFGTAIRNDISLDEFGARLQVEKTIRANPDLLAKFNEQRKFQGQAPLDEGQWRKFLVKAGSSDLYDSSEAAFLRSRGLNLTEEEAAGVARSIGSPTQPGGGVDLGQIVAEVTRLKSEVAPELARAGITDADLSLMAGGTDPGGKALAVEQILARRRALAQPTQQSSASQSSTGGFSLFEEEEALSY